MKRRTTCLTIQEKLSRYILLYRELYYTLEVLYNLETEKYSNIACLTSPIICETSPLHNSAMNFNNILNYAVAIGPALT